MFFGMTTMGGDKVVLFHQSGFHLGFLSREANVTIAELRRAKTIVTNNKGFSLARNIMELIDFLKLRGTGACFPRIFF